MTEGTLGGATDGGLSTSTLGAGAGATADALGGDLTAAALGGDLTADALGGTGVGTGDGGTGVGGTGAGTIFGTFEDSLVDTGLVRFPSSTVDNHLTFALATTEHCGHSSVPNFNLPLVHGPGHGQTSSRLALASLIKSLVSVLNSSR